MTEAWGYSGQNTGSFLVCVSVFFCTPGFIYLFFFSLLWMRSGSHAWIIHLQGCMPAEEKQRHIWRMEDRSEEDCVQENGRSDTTNGKPSGSPSTSLRVHVIIYLSDTRIIALQLTPLVCWVKLFYGVTCSSSRYAAVWLFLTTNLETAILLHLVL